MSPVLQSESRSEATQADPPGREAFPLRALRKELFAEGCVEGLLPPPLAP